MGNSTKSKTNLLKRVGGKIQGTKTPRKKKVNSLRYKDIETAYRDFMAKRGIKYSLY